MFGNIKTCKKENCCRNVWSKGLCHQHQERKPFPKISRKRETSDKMTSFFFLIWQERPHKSEISFTDLGKEPLTIYFHHILPKNKYPQAEFDKQNIILLTFEEHEAVEADMYKYAEINKRRELLKIKYNL